MINKKKFFRDIVIIIIFTAIGITVWNLYFKPPVDPMSDLSNPDMASMMQQMQSLPVAEGDGTEFEFDNAEIAMKVNGKEYSIGEIDTRAMTHFKMVSMGRMGLTGELRDVSRRDAVDSIRKEAVIEKALGEYNISVSDEEIDALMAAIKNNLNAEGTFQDFLDQMSITEEKLKLRIRKDEVENRLFLAIIREKGLQDSEESTQQEAFNVWLEDGLNNLEFEILELWLEDLYENKNSVMGENPHMGMGEIAAPTDNEETS